MAVALVGGALANKPHNGGNAWTRLTWLLGLRRLGFDVYFAEQIAPEACIDAAGNPAPFEESANAAVFRRVLRAFGFGDRAALVCGERTVGLSHGELRDVAAAADLLVNISGHLTLGLLKDGLRRKVYFDDDPGFTQFWHAAGDAGSRLEGHDFYFTVGANVGTPGCPIPTGGVHWRPTRPLVVLDEWPACRSEPNRFTTVASWRGAYGPVEYQGQKFGLKVHEFRKFVELPRRAAQTFEIALDIHPADHADRDQLARNGWRLADPRAVVADPDAYRQYVQASGAEFSAAQGVYVQTQSGWFSDRTACYLASGKPALVQNTGFGRTLPTGDGLVPFRTLDEAAAGAARIAADYERHSRAARALAEEYFDSDKVLARLLGEVGLA
jgi:hypothetical protein